jgi:mono/diheme cytochrome c family protein
MTCIGLRFGAGWHGLPASVPVTANGRREMKFLLLAAGLMSAGSTLAAPVLAQEAKQEARETGPAHPGRIVVLSKCFQCHTDAMFRDQRQDRRAWEATLYRMIGRGALWTPEEIKLMADYLGAEYGTAAKPAATPH